MVVITETDPRVQAVRASHEAHRQTHVDLVPCVYADCLLATPEGVERGVAMFIEYLQRTQVPEE